MNIAPKNWQRNLEIFMRNASVLSKRFHSSVSYRIVNPILGSCWEWTKSISSTGYGDLRVEQTIIKAPMLSWFIYKKIDTPLTGQICHICNNKKCVNPQHLYHATAAENGRYAVRCNTNSNFKLSLIVARQIREEYKLGNITHPVLAEKYRVSKETIQRVLSGATWLEN